jgi:hypothetical protein
MKIFKLLLTLSIVVLSVNSSAQHSFTIKKSDSIKSLDYRVSAIKIKNGKIIKSKPSMAYDYYPIKYPSTKSYYNKEGFLIKEDNINQRDTSYYNSKNQKIKMVLYPGNSKDSISIYYSYDNQGNIETKKMSTSAEKLDYYLEGNYYSDESIINTFYHNYYLSETDSTSLGQFQTKKPLLNTYCRLYDSENRIVNEKFLTTTKNPFPYKPDSTFHHITYDYTKDHKILKVSTVNEHIPALRKTYTSKSTEEHKYLNDDLIEDITYYNNGKLSRQMRMVYAAQDGLRELTDQWISPDRTTTHLYNSKGDLTDYIFRRKNKIVRHIKLDYTYNNRGHWITCTHRDKRNKPTYLIERVIEYY